MKEFNALFLFISLFFASIASANSFMYPFPPQKIQQQQGQAQVWPNMPQQVMGQPKAGQYIPSYAYPQMRRPTAASPYAMPYLNTAPPVLRFPPNQTFQQARPVYNANQPYSTQANPYMQQYGYPVGAQYVPPPRVNNQQAMNQQNRRPPYRKPVPVKKKKKPWGDIRYI